MPKPILKPISLDDIIVRTVKLNELSKPDIKFNIINIKKGKHLINGDEEQLNRVFLNLIKNAIESLNEKVGKNGDFSKKIDIDIRIDNDYIYCSIEDNGVGFGSTNFTKMIKPYFTTKKYGTGLGLAIVDKIINDHNGDISFQSKKNGAKVNISIPKIQ